MNANVIFTTTYGSITNANVYQIFYGLNKGQSGSHFRMWTNVLSDAEIRAERDSNTVVKTTGLWADMPLTNDDHFYYSTNGKQFLTTATWWLGTGFADRSNTYLS